MKAHCVLFVIPTVERLTLDVDLTGWPVIPAVGDVFFWNDGYGGQTVETRYVSKDGIELYLGRIGAHDVETFVAAGWKLRP